MPDVVVMKANEELIGERKGYLQRLISEGEDSLRGVSATRLAGEKYDSEHGGESGGQDRTGERDGAAPGGNPGDTERGSRPNASQLVSLELLSLSPVDRLNLGLYRAKFKEASKRFDGVFENPLKIIFFIQATLCYT